MANNIFNNFNIGYNSIADQKLTASNTLTVKAWNDIITILKTQANINATYLSSLNKWLIGNDPVSIPSGDSFVDYINTYIGEMPNTVMDIVNKNSLGFTTIDIGYSTNYNIESDKELPTTKTVNKMLDGPRKDIDDIEEALKYKADLVGGKVPLEQLDTKETGELLVGTSANYDISRDDQIPTTKAVDAMVNELKNSVDTKLDTKADLDESGRVPASQLPGYVDDVIEVDNFGDLPTPGESGKVYIVKSTNITYRWSGTQYTVIGKDLALGETPSTAFPGDRGKELELTSVKRTKENVQNTSLRDIKNRYGDVVAAQYADNKYVLLVFGTTINENNECSLTVYDNGTARYAETIWLEWTLGQALNVSGSSFNSRYTYTDKQIDKLISSSPMKTYEVDLTEASWVRLAKVKDLTKNSSGQFIFDCYGRKVNDEGTVLESITGTTPKPRRKYELEMDVTLRELYNRFNATLPFEIKLNTTYDSTKTALYFGADSTIVNNNPDTNTVPYMGVKPQYLGLVQSIPTSIYGSVDKGNGEYQIDMANYRAVTHPYISTKEEHFRLLIKGISHNHGPNFVLPIFTLYRNGTEIFKNTEYIKLLGNLTADELAQFSVQIDNVNAEDIYRIEYQSEYEDGIIIESVSLYSIYDIDSTIFTIKGFIEGTDEYIQSVESTYPITKITEYESHQEILTTSVFNVTCGLDDNGNLITDVLPITQSPELSGSDSSGGGSGGGDTGSSGGGSGGSGLTGTHGLASILLENYEGETYVCGLINFPNTGNYLGTYIEMKIENNLNFETLNRLEVVDIEEKTNNGEFQLLEGTKFEVNNSYDFVIKSTLDQFVDKSSVSFVLTTETTGYVILRAASYDGVDVIVNDTKLHSATVEYDLEHFFFRTSEGNFPISLYGGAYMYGNYDSILKNLYAIGGIGRISATVDVAKLDSYITKLAGTLTLTIGDTSEGADTIVSVTYNGVTSTYQFDEDGEGGYKNIELYFSDITLDSLLNIEGNVSEDLLFDIDRENTEVEIKTFGYTPKKDFEIEKYILDIDATVKGISYKIHKTSDSYDLFSVYNKLDKIEEKLGETKESVSYISNKFISEFIEVGVPNYGLFYNINPYFVSSVVKHFYTNKHNINLNKASRYCIYTLQGGKPHYDTILGGITQPTSTLINFISCILTTPDFELVLDGPYGEDLDHPGLSIKCNKWYVQQGGSTFDATDILKGVIILTTLDDTVMFNYNEGTRYTLGQTTPALVCISSGAGGASKSFLVTYSYRYNGNELGTNMLHATVVDVGSGTTYKWNLNFNNETYGDYDTIHKWVHSGFPEYTEVIESGINADDVLDIIEENGEQTTTLDIEEATEIAIGTSETFDGTSDNQVPTSKAVSDYVASAGGGSKLYRHDISFDTRFNSVKVSCKTSFIDTNSNAYTIETILNCKVSKLPITSSMNGSATKIYYCNSLTTETVGENKNLKAKFSILTLTMNEDNTINVAGGSGGSSVENFVDTVTEL